MLQSNTCISYINFYTIKVNKIILTYRPLTCLSLWSFPNVYLNVSFSRNSIRGVDNGAAGAAAAAPIIWLVVVIQK